MLSILFASSLALAQDAAASKEAAARKFLAQRLTVAPLQVVSVATNQYGGVVSSSTVNTWTVYQGQNTIVRGRDFAAMMNDQPMVDQMAGERTRSKLIGIPLTVGGIALFAYGTSAMLDIESGDIGGGLGGMLGGGALTGLGAGIWMGAGAKQNWTQRYYTEEKANELVDGYNKQLLTDLGISKDEVLKYLKSRGAVETQEPAYIAGIEPVLGGTY